MSSNEKSASAKRIVDVAQPGKSAPSNTSKPVLVTNRPMMQDPMVVDESKATDVPDSENPQEISTTKITLKPVEKKEKTVAELAEEANKAKAKTAKSEESEKPTEKEPEIAEEATDTAEKTDKAEQPKPDKDHADSDEPDTEKSDESDEAETDSAEQTAKEMDAAETEALAKHEAEIEKLVESKQYALPINAVEERRTKRFVILGIVLSLLLVIAWADIALDAGLIKIDNVKPVTHFFSN